MRQTCHPSKINQRAHPRPQGGNHAQEWVANFAGIRNDQGKFESFGLAPGDYLVKWGNGLQSRFHLESTGATVVEIGTVGAFPAPKEPKK